MVVALLRMGATVAPLPAGLTTRERETALALLDPAIVVDGGVLAPFPARAVAAETGPEAPAIVVLTSGTTGRPKGVVLSHRAMAASADAWLEVLPPATGWALPLGHRPRGRPGRPVARDPRRRPDAGPPARRRAAPAPRAPVEPAAQPRLARPVPARPPARRRP